MMAAIITLRAGLIVSDPRLGVAGNAIMHMVRNDL